MTRLVIGLIFGCCFGMLLVSLRVSADTPSQPPAVLQARIVQLEEQAKQLQRSYQVCTAQLLLATQPQQDKEAQERLDKAAKDMGCKDGADWTVNPPVCKSVTKD